MFIDIHVHTRYFRGPERLSGGTYASPEELMAMLKPRGVRRAVILPGRSPECALVVQSTGEVLAIVEQHPDFFITFMNIDPRQVANSPDADLGYLMLPNLVFLGHSQPFWAEISGDLAEEQRNGYPKGKVVESGALGC